MRRKWEEKEEEEEEDQEEEEGDVYQDGRGDAPMTPTQRRREDDGNQDGKDGVSIRVGVDVEDVDVEGDDDDEEDEGDDEGNVRFYSQDLGNMSPAGKRAPTESR